MGYEDIRRMLAERTRHYSLPQPFYGEPSFYQADLELIFQKQWVLAGFECQIAEPGMYFVLEIGRNSIIIVRGEDRAVRGFFNTCRHRGSRICDEASGRVKRLVCPYHQWSYWLDGTLHRAPHMHEGFDPAGFDLRPANVELIHGTIWLCLSDTPPDFAPFADAVRPFAQPHRLADAKIAYTTNAYVDANWKVVDENSRECYHCPAGHPELLKTFKNNFSRAKA